MSKQDDSRSEVVDGSLAQSLLKLTEVTSARVSNAHQNQQLLVPFRASMTADRMATPDQLKPWSAVPQKRYRLGKTATDHDRDAAG
jgi:hypothetical protein